METSLRLRGATSNTASNAGLRIHAKQKFPLLASNALLQALISSSLPPSTSSFP